MSFAVFCRYRNNPTVVVRRWLLPQFFNNSFGKNTCVALH
jgi:hypothetical protein